MIKKHISLLALMLLVLGLFSCEDKEDYITLGDLVLQEGYIKGSMSGNSIDSIAINESFNLPYSYSFNNSINTNNDLSQNFSIETMSNPLLQNEYSCTAELRLFSDEDNVEVTSCEIRLIKTTYDNKLLYLYLSGDEDLTISDYSYNPDTYTVSGKISGQLRTSAYAANGVYVNGNPFDITLDFSMKVWETVQ